MDRAGAKGMTWNRSLAALLTVLMAGAVLPGMPILANPSEDKVDCETFEDVPGQGPSRLHANGLFEVCLRDGSTLFTHGADPEGPVVAAPGFLVPIPPVCVTSTATSYHSTAIYAVPSDGTSYFPVRIHQIREAVAQANGQLRTEAAAFGVVADYKFECSLGITRVRDVVLPTAASSASFSTIVSDLKAAGFDSSLAKYWVFYEGCVSPCYGGQGNMYDDDTLAVSNKNNKGPSYGIDYGNPSGSLAGIPSWSTMMHENGHNLGAVQNSAPHTTGAHHCTDGNDVMCYDDGGPNGGSYSSTVCRGFAHFACNHDDYYHPNPPAGNYLETHWNLGHCYNRFIQRTGC